MVSHNTMAVQVRDKMLKVLGDQPENALEKTPTVAT